MTITSDCLNNEKGPCACFKNNACSLGMSPAIRCNEYRPIISRTCNEGLKFDADKQRWDLLPLKPIVETVKVLTFGAKKYGPHNWRLVHNANERYYAALMRHISAWRQGEKLDKETNVNHLAHALCDIIFLMEIEDGGSEQL